MLAVMSNADTWKDIQIWGVANQQWLAGFLELPNGIPSRDTFRRTISQIIATRKQLGLAHGHLVVQLRCVGLWREGTGRRPARHSRV